MITEAIIDFFVGLVGYILDLLPDFTVPDWLSSVTTAMTTVFAFGSSLGAWAPTNLMFIVFTAVLGAYGVGFTIKVIRIVASFFTAGGGSAA